ncbi:ABC transporter permease [Pseudalkalibacillus hwajinpoensis]|uniref:ABC transporter permease n=1 Tax=Guptibacillus hwajinpoensis TaxID=208199 RepID=UPI001CD1BC5A|nr:ABC transporter permease [Pseudalkalibacillus hwajinpoensis]MCA0992045.1 ABC transporter permease [Pseudalkalibacillus hwajinpoensis]
MTELWKKRFDHYIRHRLSYLSYIFQGGFLIAVLLAGGIGAVYYRQFLGAIPENFLTLIVTILTISIVISSLKVKFFLLPADRVFLLAYEGRMEKYIRYSFLYSYVRSLPIIILTSLLTTPVFIRLGFEENDLIVGCITLFMLHFLSFFVIIRSYIVKIKWFRFYLLVMNSAVLYLTIKGNVWIGVLVSIALTTLPFLLRRKKMLQWERLIELEASQKNRFEQFANLFVDVPSLQNQVRARRYFGFVLSLIHVHDPRLYLSVRTFLRKGSYVWMYLRLLVLGALILSNLSNEIIIFLFVPLFLWVTYQQLTAIIKEQYRDTFLIILQDNLTGHSIVKMIFGLLILQCFIYSFIQLPELHDAFIVFLEGLLFSYVLTMKKETNDKKRN